MKRADDHVLIRRTTTVLVASFAVLASIWQTPKSFADESIDWTPGTEHPVAWHDLTHSLKVFIPNDYNDHRNWPVIFFYHGTGGRPTTSLLQRYTREKGFILVGMTYAFAGGDTLSGKGVEAEIRHIQEVRTLLGRDLELDGRTYVGGFSQGGWMADLLANEGFPYFAGALIIGAGRFPNDIARARGVGAPSDTKAGTPIYIGTGQLDANYVYSYRAREHYEKRNAMVTFDEYLGQGHREPHQPASEYLFQWLRIASLSATNPEALAREAAAWWKEKHQTAESIDDPLTKYLFLQKMSRAPFAAHVPPEARRDLDSLLQRAARHRTLVAALGPLSGYEALQRRESAFDRSPELVPIGKAYEAFHREHTDAYVGKRAGLDALRVWSQFHLLRRSRPDANSAERFDKPEVSAALEAEFRQLDEKLNTWTP